MKMIEYPDAIIMMIKEVVYEAFLHKPAKAVLFMVEHEFSAALPKKTVKALKKEDEFADDHIHRSAIFQFLIYAPASSVLVLMRKHDSPTTHLEETSHWQLTAYHDDEWYKSGFDAIRSEASAQRHEVAARFAELTGRELRDKDFEEHFHTERRRFHVFEPETRIMESHHFVVRFLERTPSRGRSLSFLTKENFDRTN